MAVKLLPNQTLISICKMFIHSDKIKMEDGIHIDERLIYSLGGLAGYRLVKNDNQYALLSICSHDIYQDLSAQFGIWFNRHFSTDVVEGLKEMRSYTDRGIELLLYIDIDCISYITFDTYLYKTIGHSQNRLTSCILKELNSETAVVWLPDFDGEIRLPVDRFSEAILPYIQHWYDILYSNKVIPVRWQIIHAFYQIRDRYLSGWRDDPLAGITAIEYLYQGLSKGYIDFNVFCHCGIAYGKLCMDYFWNLLKKYFDVHIGEVIDINMKIKDIWEAIEEGSIHGASIKEEIKKIITFEKAIYSKIEKIELLN